MTLIWNLFHKQKINRISGLEFLKKFVDDQEVKATDQILLVDPQPKEAKANYHYLRSKGFNLPEGSSYLAPFYDKSNIIDPVLLAVAEERKPKYIIINLGGGTQEKLGAYLKNNLSYKPAIIWYRCSHRFSYRRTSFNPGGPISFLWDGSFVVWKSQTLCTKIS